MKRSHSSPRAVVLDHDDDRALVDGEVGVRDPVLAFAERVLEAVLAPDAIAELVIEVAERLHAVLGRVGEGGQRRRSA